MVTITRRLSVQVFGAALLLAIPAKLAAQSTGTDPAVDPQAGLAVTDSGTLPPEAAAELEKASPKPAAAEQPGSEPDGAPKAAPAPLTDEQAAALKDAREPEAFAEVRILTGPGLSIEDIRSLPLAPEAPFTIEAQPEAVITQIPAELAAGLAKAGHGLTVLREFVLVAATPKAVHPTKGFADAGNDADVSIPDLGGWVRSSTAINTAPATATVTGIDVSYQIVHTFVGDLDVDLNDENLTYNEHLWSNAGGNADNINDTQTGITTFNGELVNQRWDLWARDTAGYDTGFIDAWWIKVYYEDGLTATIYDAWWAGQVDADADGYRESAVLTWDPDVAQGSGELSVSELVYWKPAGGGSWTLFGTTACHTISGTLTADTQSLTISGLPSGLYDWKIEVLQCGSVVVDATRDPTNDSELNDYGLESGGGSTSCALRIYGASWRDIIDEDGDGYRRSGRLAWDPDTALGCSVDVFEKVWTQAPGASTWTLLHTTACHTISGYATTDAQYLDITGTSRGQCDFLIELYACGSGSPADSRDPADDSDLNDVGFEPASQDAATEPPSNPGSNPGSASKWALVVGVDHYASGSGTLNSCINDADGMRTVVLGGDSNCSWASAQITRKVDSSATKSAIRNWLQTAAAGSRPGDLYIYFHSSHGGQHSGTSTYLCCYDGNYEDTELAEDLARFNTASQVVVIIDACHSGGLFKDQEWPFTKRVVSNYKRAKATQFKQRGESVPKDLGANLAFMVACDYTETTPSGDPYSLYAGELVYALGHSSADADQDGRYSFWELHSYADSQISFPHPQYYNRSLLESLIAHCDGTTTDGSTTDGPGSSSQPVRTWYPDFDGDGYGAQSGAVAAVDQPAGYVENATDCNDANGNVYPGAWDSPNNGVDEDCSGSDSYSNTTDIQEGQVAGCGGVGMMPMAAGLMGLWGLHFVSRRRLTA